MYPKVFSFWQLSAALALSCVGCLNAQGNELKGQAVSEAERHSEQVPDVKPALIIGEDIPVDVGDMGYKMLQSDPTNAAYFTSAVPPGDLPVSAEAALQQANRTTLSELTQPPIKITVDFAYYTNGLQRRHEQPVWRVIYWGALTQPNPPPGSDGQYHPIELSGSREAVTYVLIDPFKAGGDFIESGSGGRT